MKYLPAATRRAAFSVALAALTICATPAPAPAEDTAASADDIRWLISVSLRDGGQDWLDPFVTDLLAASGTEQGTLVHEWLRNGDTVHVFARFTDSRAALDHLSLFSESYAGQFRERLSLNSMSVYGPVSGDLREALTGFSPAYFETLGGFAR